MGGRVGVQEGTIEMILYKYGLIPLKSALSTLSVTLGTKRLWNLPLGMLLWFMISVTPKRLDFASHDSVKQRGGRAWLKVMVVVWPSNLGIVKGSCNLKK
jgi:hypothetical protein